MFRVAVVVSELRLKEGLDELNPPSNVTCLLYSPDHENHARSSSPAFGVDPLSNASSIVE